MSYHFLVVGAGFSGAIIANELAKHFDCKVDVWDERNHIAGNCHTERDATTGIMVHKYGPHIFNTDRKEIWDYVNALVELKPYVHRVKALSKGNVYSFPVNLHTINQVFGKSFTPKEAREFVQTLGDTSITEPKNFEEQALKFIGKELYYHFFYGYTKKQWGCEPSELPASILKRIPVRFSYDDNYHNNIYTGIPVDGYTAIVEKLLNHDSIAITLNKKFTPSTDVSMYDHVFYTGPLDAYFDHRYGRLSYRTVTFEAAVTEGDFQGTAQVNYCDAEIPHTRITEHKHFAYWEKHDQTICFTEFSTETGPDDVPYYPKRLAADIELLKQYRKAAEELSRVSFIGRLATYRYMDMHHVIGEALDFSRSFTESFKLSLRPPVFSNEEAS
jgi:UDP-galactopyranose mutase